MSQQLQRGILKVDFRAKRNASQDAGLKLPVSSSAAATEKR